MGSSSLSNSSAHCLQGLKFDHKIYFEDEAVGAHPKSTAGGRSSSSKKGRGGTVQGAQPPRCQVEGCKVDLSDAKAYYSRNKVCGFHSKSPKVIVAGLEQRFCQQCSRFHQLTEFDQEKRSCRRRLAGHNERRRKPQHSSLLISPYARFSPAVFDNRGRVGGFLMELAAYRKPTLRNELPAASSMEQVPVNQSATPPWQGSGSRNPLGECFAGIAETSSALSLLSNQTWRLRNTPPALGLNNLCFAASSHGAPVHHLSSASASVNCLHHEVVPDLAADQISLSNSGLPGGELVMPQSEAYESSQLMHWSL